MVGLLSAYGFQGKNSGALGVHFWLTIFLVHSPFCFSISLFPSFSLYLSLSLHLFFSAVVIRQGAGKATALLFIEITWHNIT